MKKRYYLIAALLIVGLLPGLFVSAQGDTAPTLDFSLHDASPILVPGEAGEWDAQRTVLPHVMEYEGTYYMFYSGAPNLISGEGGIGLATSSDGLAWTKSPANPLMYGAFAQAIFPQWMSVMVEDDGTWVMFFSDPNYGRPAEPEIYRATAPAAEGPWEIDSEPVIRSEARRRWDWNLIPVGLQHSEDGYLMTYAGFDQFMNFPQIGLATSEDGLAWSFHDDPDTLGEAYDGSDPIVLAGEQDSWDWVGIVPTNIVRNEDRWEVFYLGFDDAPGYPQRHSIWLGYAYSLDGDTWTKVSVDTGVIETPEVNWPGITATVIDGTYHIYLDHDIGRGGIYLMTGTIAFAD